jgi:2-oxo-4-hydroxy-4-carboxy--5-ureidoimidazoline (OHCU) decarboxylase
MSERQSPETGPASEDRLDELAESFVERMRRGEAPEIEDYAREHPELAGRIASSFS